MARITLKVNGRDHQLEVDPATPLVHVLRDDLGLTGTKVGCGQEQCGACLVLVEGEAAHSCATPVGAFENRAITTIEGIVTPEDLHPLQRAFVAERAAQCGYCIPGIVVAAKALLDADPRPDEAAVRAALAGNLCRCGSQPRILKAVLRAARERGT